MRNLRLIVKLTVKQGYRLGLRLKRAVNIANIDLWPLGKRINRRCFLWINTARSFFMMEGSAQAVEKKDTQSAVNRRSQFTPFRTPFRAPFRASTKTPLRTTVRPSTGQILLSIARSRGLSQEGTKRTWIATLLAVFLLSTCFGQRFYHQPGLDVKSVSPQAFYAPTSAVFEDKQETEKRRNDVRDGAVPVLKIDSEITAAATRSLETLLQQGRELRAQAGIPPFISFQLLSKPSQDFLFQASDSQWKATWRLAETQPLVSLQSKPSATPAIKAPFSSSANSSAASSSVASSSAANSSAAAIPTPILTPVGAFDPHELKTLQELIAYRDRSGKPGLAQLKSQVESPRQQYRQAVAELARAASDKGQPFSNYQLFELSEAQWLMLESDARQIFSEMMMQGIHQGSPPDLLRRAIESRVQAWTGTRVSPLISSEIQQLTADVIAEAITPNLVLDEARTKQHAEQAVREITPVMVSVQADDLIVLAGDTIDAADFAKLDYFGFTGRYFNWMGLCGFSVLIASAIALYLWIDHWQDNPLNQRDHLLILVLCLVAALLAALRVPTMGLPAVGILIASFYGSALGLSVVGLLTLILPIGTPVQTIPLIAGAAAAMLGTWIAPQLRAREEFALLGGFVGLAQASMHLILTLVRSTAAAPLWKVVFLGSAVHGLYGIAWSVVALGVSPYLEHFFDVVTPIRLAELANPNRPLLQRLAAEAPGTFQHTMFVANLAEAAARAVGRNVELVRAGTLYHDIGKMHDPQGFIENQMGGLNKHDVINNPWESASIIKKHVTQGLVMARQYRLPKAVQAFIPEHQGDMKISYFYQQAKEKQAAEPSLVVDEADFRYDGPIPQSPETGITMLADSCEAALRSLKPETSMDEAYAMVENILRDRWRNRQLAESGLTRDDMDVIASVFIQVWQQHNHKRVAYPKDLLTQAPAGCQRGE